MKLVRTDILYDRKCIHVKIKKDVLLKLREKLLGHQLSIQAVFDEFANLIVNEEKRATRIVEELVLKKAKEQIEKTTKKIAPTRDRFNELDHNTIYNLINAEERKRKPDDEPV